MDRLDRRVAVVGAVAACLVALAAVVGLAAGPAASAPGDFAAGESAHDAQSWGSVEYEVVVSADGEIDRATIVWTVDGDRYADVLAAAEADGYDSPARWWADDIARDEPGLGGVDAEDREVDGGYALEMTFEEIDADTYRMMNASVEDGTVSWERLPHDGGLSNPAFGTLTYRVVMPGDVVDTNAAEVDGEEATWHLNEEDPGRLYATSERGGLADAIPGFGVTVAVLAVATALGLARRRR